MARPERNNVDYFPHPVTHGKKMFYLRNKFKNDGYTVWFMLLEELGKADYHFLDLKDEVQIMYLSSLFLVEENILNDIIDVLVKFGEFDKPLWEESKIIFSQKFIDSIEDAYKKRSNICIDRDSLLLLIEGKSIPKPPISELKGPVNPQRIGKDRIGKETKEKESKGKPSPSSSKNYSSKKREELNIEKFKNIWLSSFRKDPTEFIIETFKKYWNSMPDTWAKNEYQEDKVRRLYKMSGGDPMAAIAILKKSKKGELVDVGQ